MHNHQLIHHKKKNKKLHKKARRRSGRNCDTYLKPNPELKQTAKFFIAFFNVQTFKLRIGWMVVLIPRLVILSIQLFLRYWSKFYKAAPSVRCHQSLYSVWKFKKVMLTEIIMLSWRDMYMTTVPLAQNKSA